MTEKLIALVDASLYATSVCKYAAWIAARTGAAVELLHVLGRHETSGHDLSGAISLGARSALLAELADLDEARAKLMAQKGRAILDDAAALLKDSGVGNVTSQLRHGDIVDTVAEQEARASMIVIGKRGEAADFAKGHLGSNLERIVRASHKPVFVASRAFRPITRVLVAYDGGTSAMKAVDYMSRTALFKDLSVDLATIGADTPEARAHLGRAKDTLAAAGIAAETAITQGPREESLLSRLDNGKYDLLIMGAFGRSRIRELIIGSTTTTLLRKSKTPVLLVR